CMRYGQDSESENRKNGRFFERFARDYDFKTTFDFGNMDRLMYRYDCFRSVYGTEMNEWLLKHDKSKKEEQSKMSQ
ncbi:hypothetical protein PFISCL1PPCAC_727, partial [Pristionchus fissidentatus]